MEQNNKNNPFKVRSPEKIEAHEVISLFVNVFNDFPTVLVPGDTFMNGPRGCGKSMMYRYMLPDCQCIKNKCEIFKLDYYAVYIPIKATNFDKTELNRLREQANVLLNEHILVTHIATRVFNSLANIPTLKNKEIVKFFNEEFIRRCRISGWKEKIPEIDLSDSINIFQKMHDICEEMHSFCIDYCDKLSFIQRQIPTYKGPLCTYLNFLHPLLSKLINHSYLPENLYLLIDDADNLNEIQTKILNNWVSYRLGTQISLKISTQMRYKTFQTTSGPTIDAPHDYSEMNIATVYTSSKDKYINLVHDIVKKRLKTFSIENIDPYLFFPIYQKQENRIKEIYKDYIVKFEIGKGRGNKKNDDAYRYSRPDYIKGLGGKSKQKSNYYYAGFEQLVHLSSGIIRFFLESAALMFSEMEKQNKTKKVKFITPSVQNKIAREYADDFLFQEFDKFKKDASVYGYSIEKMHQLRNLIDALGGCFSVILNSNASERRVFSIAFMDTPDDELQEILDLGRSLGYFQFSTIGNKEGTGRTGLYILNRRLAPSFTLDPTSFAGYRFFMSKDIRLSLMNPKVFIDLIKKKVNKNPNEDLYENTQLEIFN